MKSVKIPLAAPMLALGVTLIASSLAAKTIYVAEDGNDDTGDGTAENPYATPKKGVAEAKAETDDVVFLKNGTYPITAQLTLNKKITLRGESRDGVTIKNTAAIASWTQHRVVVVSTAGARVESLTMRDGNVTGNTSEASYSGGNVKMTVAGVISNCVITAGLGPYKAAGDLTVGDLGGGNVYATAGTITHCIISNGKGGKATNEKVLGAGLYIKGAVTVDTCLIVGNDGGNSSWGGGIFVANTTGTKIQNCTIVGNKAMKGAGIYNAHNNTVIKNCIIARNITNGSDSSSGAPNWFADSSKVSVDTWANNVSYTIWGNDGDCQNVGNTKCYCMDPGFSGAATGDYTLADDSQAVGRGVWYEGIPGDLNGTVRRDPPDPGCYQSLHDLPLSCTAEFSPDKAAAGSVFTFTATTEHQKPGADYDYYWTLTDLAGNSVTLPEHASIVSAKINNPGDYQVHLSVSNRAVETDNSFADATGRLLAYQLTNYYVTSVTGATPIRPYATPETAATSIHDVIDIVPAGATVVLDAGEHKVRQQITIATNLLVRGAGREATVLRMVTANTRVFNLNHSDAELRDLTVTGASGGDVGMAIYMNTRGGKVINCGIVGNTLQSLSRVGGAICADSPAALFDRCVVAFNTNRPNENVKGYVRGVVRVKDGTIRNSIVRANCHLDKWGDAMAGHIVHLEGAATMWNCTVVDNEDFGKGGATVFLDGTSTIKNSIFAGNSTPNNANDIALPDFLQAGWQNTYTCCFDEVKTFKNGTDVGSLTAVDPCFVDAANGNYRLTTDSPCRKKGTYDEWMADALDVYGKPRCSGVSTVDIGAAALPKQGLMLILR